uniref:Uncharacterized protein n=1 Tax=Plectus sambesii TaxID=2011161 RepID=A0A914XRF5_9BILA
MLSTVATSYFYHKLQKFVTANLKRVDANRVVKKDAIRTKQEDRQESDTRAVMKMVKLATLLPLVLQSGVYVLNGFQWFIPEDLLPMWGRRLLSVSFVIVPMCVPWVSLLILGPYKRELKRRFSATLGRRHTVTTVASAM